MSIAREEILTELEQNIIRSDCFRRFREKFDLPPRKYRDYFLALSE